jgi:hypothetical protein
MGHNVLYTVLHNLYVCVVNVWFILMVFQVITTLHFFLLEFRFWLKCSNPKSLYCCILLLMVWSENIIPTQVLCSISVVHICVILSTHILKLSLVDYLLSSHILSIAEDLYSLPSWTDTCDVEEFRAIVVLDGTWNQARGLYAHNPDLKKMRKVSGPQKCCLFA